MPRIGVLITARLKSSRLPLKIINPLGDSEVVAQVIRRAKQVSGCSEVILCTSAHPQDAPLARIALRERVSTFNGHPDDVLVRLRDAANFYGLDACVSITADNPFFCIHHANRVADVLQRQPTTDYVHISGLPIGASVYGLSSVVMEVATAIKTQIDTEIWGPFVNRPEFFNVEMLEATSGYAVDVRLTIDEPADYDFAVRLASMANTPVAKITLHEIRSIIDRHKSLKSINNEVVQKSVSTKLLQELDELFLQKSSEILCMLKNIRKTS